MDVNTGRLYLGKFYGIIYSEAFFGIIRKNFSIKILKSISIYFSIYCYHFIHEHGTFTNILISILISINMIYDFLLNGSFCFIKQSKLKNGTKVIDCKLNNRLKEILIHSI